MGRTTAQDGSAELAALVRNHAHKLAEYVYEELAAPGWSSRLVSPVSQCRVVLCDDLVRLLLWAVEGEGSPWVLEGIARRLAAGESGGAAVDAVTRALWRAGRRLLHELRRDELVREFEEQSRLLDEMMHVAVDRAARYVSEAEEDLLEGLGAAAGPVVVVDAATRRIVAGSKAAEELSGYSAHQLRWLPLAGLVPDLVGERWERLAASAGIAAGGDGVEGRLITRRGEERMVAATAAGLAHGQRQLLHITLVDVTEHVRRAEQFSGLASELERRVDATVQELEEQRTFLASVLDAIPLRLLVLDEDMTIVHANPAYCRGRGLSREEVIGRPLSDVFPNSILEEAGLSGAIQSSLESGESARWAGYRLPTQDHGERIIDIRLDPCQGPGGRQYMVLTIEDVTLRHRQLYERTLLQQIMRAMLEAGDLRRLLYAILTGMTAGGTCGLGFNRAFLLLADEEEGVLRGEMAVGPESAEEAYCIWQEVASEYQTIDDFMRDYDKLLAEGREPLADLVSKMVFSMRDVEHLPMYAAARGEAVHVRRASTDPRVPDKLRQLLGVEEFVVAPMLVKEKIIGVAVADNFVTGEAIDHEDVSLLTSLTNHAALAIDNARARERERKRAVELREALEQLEQAQSELVRSKQLAAIGEVAAIVAHEIRNPLSTIGGFARILARKPGDAERVQRNARIILEEVERLERILGELLELSRPRELRREPTDVARLVEEVASAMGADPIAEHVEIVVEAEEGLPQVLLDRGQFRQVLGNLVRNGIEAMPEGGRLTLAVVQRNGGVAIDVADTGVGIPEERLGNIFDAFVTTKPSGTGLGLALSRAIVRQHEARLTVKSKVGEGTVFTIWFPPQVCVRDGAGPAEMASHREVAG